jgi:hypothetical protein
MDQEDHITRVVDPRTEYAVLVLAGCGRDGTTAAGVFVSEPKYMEALAAQAPPGWSRRNLQVAIATDLIKVIPGFPGLSPLTFGDPPERRAGKSVVPLITELELPSGSRRGVCPPLPSQAPPEAVGIPTLSAQMKDDKSHTSKV